jgi:hypothetical protein
MRDLDAALRRLTKISPFGATRIVRGPSTSRVNPSTLNPGGTASFASAGFAAMRRKSAADCVANGAGNAATSTRCAPGASSLSCAPATNGAAAAYEHDVASVKRQSTWFVPRGGRRAGVWRLILARRAPIARCGSPARNDAASEPPGAIVGDAWWISSAVFITNGP